MLARSTVLKDLPAWSIVSGAPALLKRTSSANFINFIRI